MYNKAMKYFCFGPDTKFSVVTAGIGMVSDHVHIRRTMSNCELFIVIEGELYIDQDGNEYRLRAGDYLLTEIGKQFGGYDRSTCKFLWTHFVYDGACFADEPRGEFSFPQNGHLDRYDLIMVEQTLIVDYMLFDWKNPVANAMCAALLRDLALMVMPQKPEQDNDHRFQTILEYFRYHPYCNDFDDVKSMAEYFGYSEKYLFELFKRHMAQSPHRYMTVQKIQRAKEMLATSDLTVKGIATTLHYDYYYFMRLFRRETGMSPTQYRKTVVPNLVTENDGKDT